MTTNQQTDENVGHFLNMRRAEQGVKMLCGTMQSGTGGHPILRPPRKFVEAP